jgi:hypothetical protein
MLLGIKLNMFHFERFLFCVTKAEDKLRLFVSRFKSFDLWSMELFEPFEQQLNVKTVGSVSGFVVSKGTIFIYGRDVEGKIYRFLITYEFDKKNELIFKIDVENWTQVSSCPPLKEPQKNMIFPYRAQRNCFYTDELGWHSNVSKLRYLQNQSRTGESLAFNVQRSSIMMDSLKLV